MLHSSKNTCRNLHGGSQYTQRISPRTAVRWYQMRSRGIEPEERGCWPWLPPLVQKLLSMTKPRGTAWEIHTTSRTSRQRKTDSARLGLQKRCHPKETLPPCVSGPNPPDDIDQYHTTEVNITDSSWLNWLQSTQSMNQMLSRWYTVFDLPKQSLRPETQRSIVESEQTRQNVFLFWPLIYHFTLKRFLGLEASALLPAAPGAENWQYVWLCLFVLIFFSFSSCLY